MSDTKKIRITRDILLGGEHAEEGSIHEVERPLAQRLIGEGSAVHHLEEGDEPETGPTTVDRMERPGNREPTSKRLSGPAPKVKEK
jgi:hypothetical protein